MVYVPYEVVRRWMLERWGLKKKELPDTPPLTLSDISIEWFKILDWVPESSEDFERFRNQFGSQDRNKVYCSRYLPKTQWSKRRGR